ncbi:hypothetical protein FACS189451_08670 [Bacteroidia bacterium]|nr:hypothetical protein FACS189451_08670 [Bacteroidia bacterium]
METVKFQTRISNNGILSLPMPIASSLYDTEVEVILLPIDKKNNALKKSDFKKWAGAFKVSDDNYNNAIYESLKEKHK